MFSKKSAIMSAALNLGKERRVSGAHKNDERTKGLQFVHLVRGKKLGYLCAIIPCHSQDLRSREYKPQLQAFRLM